MDVGIVGEDSTLSLTGPSVVASFLEIQNRFWGDEDDLESTRSARPQQCARRRREVVHEGASYRLEIKQVK